jgi:hypothetical protein
MATHLRVYPRPEVDEDERLEFAPPSVRVRLGDLLPLVALAQKFNYIFLQDFLDDEVSITPDLHDVLQAFRTCQTSA